MGQLVIVRENPIIPLQPSHPVVWISLWWLICQISKYSTNPWIDVPMSIMFQTPTFSNTQTHINNIFDLSMKTFIGNILAILQYTSWNFHTLTYLFIFPNIYVFITIFIFTFHTWSIYIHKKLIRHDLPYTLKKIFRINCRFKKLQKHVN